MLDEIPQGLLFRYNLCSVLTLVRVTAVFCLVLSFSVLAVLACYAQSVIVYMTHTVHLCEFCPCETHLLAYLGYK